MFLFNNSIKNTLVKYLPVLGLFAFVMLFTEQAWAQQSLGAVIGNVVNSSSGIPGLLSGLSYLFGIILGFMGIIKLKHHVEDPNSIQIWDPIRRFIAGGSFLAFPTVIRAVYETVAKDTEVLKGSNFNTGGAKGEGLDAKLVALVADIWEPLQWLFVGFGYIAGLVLIMIGISRLLKGEQQGQGGLNLGIIVTFIVAGFLLSLNRMLGAASESIFSSGAKNFASLSYTAGMDGDAIGHANAVIGAVMAFVAIIGWISFIRGFFIMRAVAEGNSQQASAMAGFTHIIGGAIAVNLGAFIQAVQNTLKIEEYGLTISSLEPYLTSVTFIV